jgi:hypothetical protein
MIVFPERSLLRNYYRFHLSPGHTSPEVFLEHFLFITGQTHFGGDKWKVGKGTSLLFACGLKRTLQSKCNEPLDDRAGGREAYRES